MQTRSTFFQRGFTLLEMIIVIVIMGVIFGAVTIFMKGATDSFVSVSRRSALTDIADTTMLRISRDLHSALPNSVRTGASGSCVEFIPTKTGGIYRSQPIVAGDDTTSLDFTKADTRFNMIGDHQSLPSGVAPVDQQIASGDLIVVNNQGVDGADAYKLQTIATVVSAGTAVAGETPIVILPKQFPLQSPDRRFSVVPAAEQSVSYVCSGDSIYRVAHNALSSTVNCSVGIFDPKIALKVDCSKTSFNVADSGNVLSRSALAELRITMTDGGESVPLIKHVKIDNTP